MKKAKIVLFGDPVLREIAQPVKVFHKKLHSTIDTIRFTLMSVKEGAALAANQISIQKKITVIDYLDEYIEMINPEIVSYSGEQTGYEGCLSFPGFSGRVKRAETVKVEFQDRNGNKICIERSGQMARCIQHEIDHLNGILYIDRMDDEFIVNDEDKTKISISNILKITPPVNFKK
jgi:peptide deformylase